MIDNVIRVTDKESFLWTRRLVKQEGIFCGGSSGSAVAAAMKYVRDLTPDHLVVVVLPDSGSRYLSKVFDDKWMRENGFLETTWAEATLADILARKSARKLVTAGIHERMLDVIGLMKAHDISQVPALHPDGTLAGMITEVDLLIHMLEADHRHSPEETVDSIVQEAQAVYPSTATLDEVLPAIAEGLVILVVDNSTPTGILTKIDILDYLSQEI